MYGAATCCALLGFADDYIKIVRRRSLGISARMKLGVTILISIGLWWIVTEKAGLQQDAAAAARRLPGRPQLLRRDPVPHPHLHRRRRARRAPSTSPTASTGSRRAARRSSLLSYIGITFITTGQHDLALLSACLVGACVGFLWFNAFPATIFMGDTGSLGLGGAIAGLAVMTKTEILLILIGGIFVVEALSVLIQVFSFQTFRKRVFLMAPIHHHFELMAWSETKIILRFWIVAAICSAIGFTLYQYSVTLSGPAARGARRRPPRRRRARLTVLTPSRRDRVGDMAVHLAGRDIDRHSAISR